MVCLQPSGAVLKPDVSAEGEANEAKNLEGQVLGKKNLSGHNVRTKLRFRSGHGAILVRHCPMTDSYLQLCKRV